jgi:hypothetical protein
LSQFRRHFRCSHADHQRPTFHGFRLRPYIEENVKFFTDILPGQTEPLGSPGGAAKVGAVDADTEMVAALPPQGH